MRRILSILAALVFANTAIFAADEVAQPETATAEVKVEEAKPDFAIATVNGQKILNSAVESELSKAMERMQSYPEQVRNQYAAQLKNRIIDNLVIENLLDGAVKAKDIKVTKEQVKEEIDKAAQSQGLSPEDFQDMLKSMNRTIEEVEKVISRQIGYRELFEGLFEGKIEVTDEQAQEYYNENKAEFEAEEEVRASHILLKFPEGVTDEQKAELKKEAEALLAKVKAGEDFAELAKEHSACGSAKDGGDLNFFSRKRMVPEFSEAAFSLEKGEIYDTVVETQFGYHIIKTTDKKEAKTETFEDAKEAILAKLKGTKQNEIVEEYISKIKSEATIEYDESVKPKTPVAVPGEM